MKLDMVFDMVLEMVPCNPLAFAYFRILIITLKTKVKLTH